MIKQDPNLKFWLSTSIVCAIAFSFSGWKLAFQTAYVVQDDARQHVFWMQRFLDRELFPQDLIADYFQSVAPVGYSLLYRLAATLGIEPLLLSKLLPALLGVVLSLFAFGVCLTLFPLPFAGFLSVLLLNQNLWMVDDLSSGTPRAFFYPLFLGFLYFFLHRKRISCCLMILLQGLFYPQSVLLSLATLGVQFLVKLKSDFKHRDYRLILPCMAVAIAVLAIYAQSSSEFAPIISVERAKELPEFSATGRAAFWNDNPFRFWLLGRSGLLPHDWPYLIMFSFGAVVPILKGNTNRFPLARHLTAQSSILIEILIASLGCFLLAHLFLFRLHLPSRYIHHSLRILIALADGIAIAIFLDTFSGWIAAKINWFSRSFPPGLKIGVTMLGIVLLLLPTYAVSQIPGRLGYFPGTAPSLYKFLQQQPKDALIATLTLEGDFIPTFAQRSVLAAAEYSIPYHWGYYAKLRQRVMDSVNAQYSQDLSAIKAFIVQYNVQFWLVAKNAFSVHYLANSPWLMQYQPAANKAIANLNANKKPILPQLKSCTVFEDENNYLLQTDCILSASESIPVH